MEKYHKTSPTRSQSIRLFNMMHELNYQQMQAYTGTIPATINADVIDKFMKSVGLHRQQDLVKFMHAIDKNDKQMRAEYWGICISQALKQLKINNQKDYDELHSHIKSLLIGTYVKPQQNYEQWDGWHRKTINQKDTMYVRIGNLWGQLSLFVSKIDFMMFSANIESINNCFAMINLYPEKTGEIVQIYQTVLSGTFLQTLQFALTMNVPQVTLIEMLKSLTYIYQSLKYQKIRKILQPSFLLQPSTLQGLLQSIKDKRPQIRYYTCTMMAQMVNNIPALSTIILSNKTLLYDISNGIAQIREQEGLMFGIQFLRGVVKGFQGLNQQEKQANMEIITVYLKFVVGKLGELKSEQSQAVCIKLVLEVVKVVDLDDQNIKLLKFVSTIFQGPKLIKFQPLFQLAMDIAKYSIIFGRKNIQKSIVGDKSFETYLKHLLSNEREDWEPFYSSLQVLLIMSTSPEHADTLFQRDLIPSIFKLVQSQSSIVQFYLSQIVLTLLVNSLESEWKLTYLYQKQCLRIIGSLIGNSIGRDPVLQREYLNTNGVQNRVSFINKNTFINALKSLYFINYTPGNMLQQKKKQNYVKNFSLFFIGAFSDGILNYFNAVTNQFYMAALLREQHSLGRDTNQRQGPMIKLFKLMSNVVQEMTMYLRKRDVELQIMKQVNRIRHQLHSNLYACLTYNQLIVESIPVYLTYCAQIGTHLVRQRIYRLSWNQFRSLLWDFIKKVLNFDADYFKILQKNTGIQIRNQDDYRKFIEKVFMDYRRSEFRVDVVLENIREKVQQRQQPISGTASHRIVQTEARRDIPRFMSARMPQTRDLSPYNSNRGSSRSPNFGTPCRECRRPTTNRSLICNACVQNHNYR